MRPGTLRLLKNNNCMGGYTVLTKTEVKTDAKKILIVDDEQDIVVIIGKLLERNGYKVMTATDGMESIAKVEAEPPDLILLDNIMPNMDGLAVLAKLRSSPKTADIPVIMLSAATDEDYIVAAQESGVSDYVIKPFEYEVLLKKIARVLDGNLVQSPSDSAGSFSEPRQ